MPRETIFTMDTSSIKYGPGATRELGHDLRPQPRPVGMEQPKDRDGDELLASLVGRGGDCGRRPGQAPLLRDGEARPVGGDLTERDGFRPSVAAAGEHGGFIRGLPQQEHVR